ncbi:MAG: hypothetical protein CMD83_00660 [Gammaproteobacteria bacterium]|nr:hypothetical protein [Gammaproteobacteria bacterium]
MPAALRGGFQQPGRDVPLRRADGRSGPIGTDSETQFAFSVEQFSVGGETPLRPIFSDDAAPRHLDRGDIDFVAERAKRLVRLRRTGALRSHPKRSSARASGR